MKICIARLRSRVNYVQPLHDIMDSFCESLKFFVKRHPEHTFSYYNFGFNQKPQRDVDAVAQADVIIIPSEAEFTYHVPGLLHSLDVKKSNEHVATLIPHVSGKKVIVMRSDRRDDEELYRKVFPIDFTYDEIDEIDFKNNIHSLKYHYIRRLPEYYGEFTFDFAYWGTDKRRGIDGKQSGDVRHKVLKDIRKDQQLNTMLIGRFYGVERDQKFQKMIDIIPTLQQSMSTLCFNWMSNKATTSRYVEAVACGMIPFVWQDYDSTDIFVHDKWQRVSSSEELIDKVKQLTYNNNFRSSLYDGIHFKFLSNLKTENEYYEDFDQLLSRKL